MSRPAGQARTGFPFALSVTKRSRNADGQKSKPWLCIVLFACTLLLAGCMQASKAHFVRHYTLKAAASSLAPGAETQNPNGRILQIAPIVVPEWLDGTAMYYRLDYQANGRLAAYANSDWIAAPATLLEPLLQQAMLADDGWRAVIGSRSPATADVTLQIRLDDFAQAFPRPGNSTGVLDATATLISNRDEHVIAQRHFHIEIAAPTSDAQGGAKALGNASAEFANQLRRWTDSAAAGTNAAEHR